MSKSRTSTKIRRRAMVSAGVAALMFAAPTAVFALNGVSTGSFAPAAESGARFTPSSVDPALARRVSARLEALGERMPFTPAGSHNPSKTVTVAVRVDGQRARAITVRGAIRSAQASAGRTQRIAIAPTRYNLGVARGYESFAKPLNEPKTLVGVSKLDMPKLDQFRPAEPTAPDKPSRLKPRISLEQGVVEGRSPGTLEAKGEQSVDLGGAYSITRNLDVTAGVRLSQDPSRQAPLADSVQDSQAVYVGTQFRF